jgi:hypothetical protein
MLFLDQHLFTKVASFSVVRGCGLVPWQAASTSEASHEGEDEAWEKAAFKAPKALLQYKMSLVA